MIYTSRALAVQLATIIFTSRLKQELTKILPPSGNSARDAPVRRELGAGISIPADITPEIQSAYDKSIKSGLALAIAFAALGLVFALALPWPKLKGGTTQ